MSQESGGVDFWRQPQVLQSLAGQLTRNILRSPVADAKQEAGQSGEQRQRMAPSKPARKAAHASRNEAAYWVDRIRVELRDMFFRTENEFGLMLTLRGAAIVVRVNLT